MKISRSTAAGAVAALALSLLANGPARAADSDITVGNAICDFAAAGYGHGSAKDPFIISSAKTLQEMTDCSNRDSGNNRAKAISAVTINGNGTVTYTVDGTHGAYGVGQMVTVTGTDSGTFNVVNAKVLSATATSVTIYSAVASGSTSGGTIVSSYDYFKLGADINLATSANTDWNDLRAAVVTAASASGGTVTYTAANTFSDGQAVFINGMGDATYNLGHVTIDTATSTSFTVTGTSVVDGSASSAGGEVNSTGWSPLEWLSNFDLDGAGHTIAGLTIHRGASQQGLIGYAERANIRRLTMSGIHIDATSNDRGSSRDYVGGVLAFGANVNASDINVSGEVIGSHDFIGIAFGRLNASIVARGTAAGNVGAGRIHVASTTDNDGPVGIGNSYYNRWGHGFLGGFIGYITDGSIEHIASSADVNGFATSQDGESNTVYFSHNGGAIGGVNETAIRYIDASGDVTGGSATAGAIGWTGYDGEMSHGTSTGSVTGITNNDWTLSGVGGYAGTLEGEAQVSYISSSGPVNAIGTAGATGSIEYVGGLTAYMYCCGATSNVEASSSVTVQQDGTGSVGYVGGLYGGDDCCDATVAGHATGNVTINSTNGGNVSDVGGFIGAYYCCGTYRDSYSTGDVVVNVDTETSASAESVGGFIGHFYCCGAITGSYSTGDVTVNKGRYVGGFVGMSDEYSSYRDSYATGNVSTSFDGAAFLGGFAGYTYNRTVFKRVSASGNVTATPVTVGQSATTVGGLFGYLSGSETVTVNDSYYKGTVTASDTVAGLIGDMDSTLQMDGQNNYVAATVVATGTSPTVHDPVSNGHWVDMTGTNFVDSTLAGTGVNTPEFTPATSAQMKSASTFTARGWAFSGAESGWRIASSVNGGYPYLVIPSADDSTIVIGSGGKTYTALKSVSFRGKSTRLSKRNKAVLYRLAKSIASSDYSVVVLRGRPSKGTLNLVTARQRAIYVYLSKQLNKLHATQTIRLENKIKSSKKAKGSIAIVGGK